MKYEIGSFSVDGERVGGCEDEGETLWILGTLIWKAFVMIGTSSSCRHLYYHLFIVALGVMRQFNFFPPST